MGALAGCVCSGMWWHRRPWLLCCLLPSSGPLIWGRSETIQTWETRMRGPYPLSLPSLVPFDPGLFSGGDGETDAGHHVYPLTGPEIFLSPNTCNPYENAQGSRGGGEGLCFGYVSGAFITQLGSLAGGYHTQLEDEGHKQSLPYMRTETSMDHSSLLSTETGCSLFTLQ